MKKALILDLDNTVYPVKSISEKLFKPLYNLIDDGMNDEQAAIKAKEELTRRPFQHVAEEYGFSEELTDAGTDMLRNCIYDEPMQPYAEYEVLRNVKADKFLVTTGFTKLQFSKVNMLGVQDDFKKVYVVDPDQSDKTKGDIFAEIMQENGYSTDEVLVIGDDPQSEIKFAKQLGIDTFLFDPEGNYPDADVTYRAIDYKDVAGIVSQG
jgi:putative hydrolase of the HAD superfamily